MLKMTIKMMMMMMMMMTTKRYGRMVLNPDLCDLMLFAVEEIYKDRAAFSERVRELVHDDLKAMGFELVSYTVTHIDDQNGYMESLGATQTALVKREAAEGKARNESEAEKKVAAFEAEAQIARAMASREAHVSVNMQKQNEAESDRDLNMKNAEYNAQVNKARAEAEYAGRIEVERQQQGVIREKTQQEVVQSEVRQLCIVVCHVQGAHAGALHLTWQPSISLFQL